MDKSYVIRLQKSLGTTPDGIIGSGTLTALFKEFGAKPDRATILGQAANVYFEDFGVLDSPLTLCHFMAQASHETGGFTWLEEIASGAAYEGRLDLGNTKKGDGIRFKGYGIFQLTGRANYILYSKRTGIDLVTNPSRAGEADISLIIAVHYWKAKGLSNLALKDDLSEITRRINGGQTHLKERGIQLTKAKALFGLKA